MLAPVLLLAVLLEAAALPDSAVRATPAPTADALVLIDAGRLESAPAMLEPGGLVVDALGHVWASDAAAHRLFRWDGAGRPLDGIGALGSGDNEFRRPGALARLGSLGVAVLDLENRRVVAYDLLGRRTDLGIALDDPALEARTGRITAVGLAADRGAGLVLADAERDRVLAFDFAGQFVRALGGFGSAAGAFRGLVAIAVTPRGEIVTAERPGSAPKRRGGATAAAPPPARVQLLDPSGAPLASWPLADGSALPVAVAADDSGRVAVSTRLAGGGCITVYDRLGRRLGATTAAGAAAALAFGADGSLWVAQAAPPGVRRFTLAPADPHR